MIKRYGINGTKSCTIEWTIFCFFTVPKSTLFGSLYFCRKRICIFISKTTIPINVTNASPRWFIIYCCLRLLGRNYDKVIEEWKKITFDSRKFQQMGDINKLLEDQFLSILSFVVNQERKKWSNGMLNELLLLRQKRLLQDDLKKLYLDGVWQQYV